MTRHRPDKKGENDDAVDGEPSLFMPGRPPVSRRDVVRDLLFEVRGLACLGSARPGQVDWDLVSDAAGMRGEDHDARREEDGFRRRSG
jgi:hypothetical protein